MLDGDEVKLSTAALRKVLKSMEYREKHNVALKDEPLEELREPALMVYVQLTGLAPLNTAMNASSWAYSRRLR